MTPIKVSPCFIWYSCIYFISQEKIKHLFVQSLLHPGPVFLGPPESLEMPPIMSCGINILMSQ